MSHPDESIELEEHAKGTLLKDAAFQLADARLLELSAGEPQLQQDIMTRILRSDLVASGFPLGAPKRKAFLIPTDLFIRGDVDWKKSTVSRLDEGFSDVRLLPEVRKVISKSKGKTLADYSAVTQLTENEAAQLLGISRRTLQGYRSKGGGPAFHVIGKAYKYNAGDLRTWQSVGGKS